VCERDAASYLLERERNNAEHQRQKGCKKANQTKDGNCFLYAFLYKYHVIGKTGGSGYPRSLNGYDSLQKTEILEEPDIPRRLD